MVKKITVETIVNSSIDKVWKMYTTPSDIIKWNHASDDWHTPSAKNDLKVGGSFSFKMEAKDKSIGFDFEGKYIKVENYKLIAYKMSDGRGAKISFDSKENKTKITIEFDAENENSIEMQKSGWQAILNNFKKYAENN